MQVLAVKTTLFTKASSLESFIGTHLETFAEKDILVVTSKIVGLGEGRSAEATQKARLVRSESEEVIETPWAALTRSESGWGINAGIDESNAEAGTVILLPKDPFASATRMRRFLKEKYGIRECGVLITDTRSVPLRIGTIGRAIGFAGFAPIRSYVGVKDLFGRESRVTVSNLADALAASAVAVMGEGAEQTPLAVVRDAPVTFMDRHLTEEEMVLSLHPEKDIFAKLYQK